MRPAIKGSVLAQALIACALSQVGAALAQGARGQADVAALSPEKILLTMKKKYAGCRSYRDEGSVRTATIVEGGQSNNEQPFATTFVRPGRFRFVFTDRGLGERSSSYIVWSDGTTVSSWFDAKPGVRHPEWLQEALDVAAGISGGVSIRVPGLLLPATVGEGPPLVGAERIEDGVDRDVPCFRIKGKSRTTPYSITISGRTMTVQDETVIIWIDRAKFLLRKIEQTRVFDTYRSVNTATYTPEIDVEIPDAQLAFGVPEAE